MYTLHSLYLLNLRNLLYANANVATAASAECQRVTPRCGAISNFDSNVKACGAAIAHAARCRAPMSNQDDATRQPAARRASSSTSRCLAQGSRVDSEFVCKDTYSLRVLFDYDVFLF